MSRVFAYCRVSTLEQTTENQRREIEAAGFTVKPQRLIEEQISGSVAASERPGFARLLDRMENDDARIRRTGSCWSPMCWKKPMRFSLTQRGVCRCWPWPSTAAVRKA